MLLKNMETTTKSFLRNTEQITLVNSTQNSPAKVNIQGRLKTCVLCVVRSRNSSYEHGYFLHSLFIIRSKQMFRKAKLLLVFPLTAEIKVMPQGKSFVFCWESSQPMCVLNTNESVINSLMNIINDFSRFQSEPFSLDCSHHRWLWYYQEFMPKLLVFPNRTRASTLPASLNPKNPAKNEEIKGKITVQKFTLAILTWNAATNSPSGSLAEWLQCKGKRFETQINPPDVIVIGLQEMCELTKILGDSKKAQEWVLFLENETRKAFKGTQYKIVRNKKDI
jgi:hypothetical protein